MIYLIIHSHYFLNITLLGSELALSIFSKDEITDNLVVSPLPSPSPPAGSSKDELLPISPSAKQVAIFKETLVSAGNTK